VSPSSISLLTIASKIPQFNFKIVFKDKFKTPTETFAVVKVSNSEPESHLLLPRNRESLNSLLQVVSKIIEPLNIIQQHQRYRVDTLRKSASEPFTTVLSRREQLLAMRSVRTRVWAEGIPDLRLVDSYLNQERLHRLIEGHRCSTNRLHQIINERPLNPVASASSLQAVVDKQEELLAMLLDLRSRIMYALDRHGDTRKDTRKKIVANLPKNKKILDLYTLLERRDTDNASERAFAIDFCEGDEKEAASLLKGVSRYRKRLKEAEALNDM